MQGTFFNRLLDERMDEIQKISKQNDFNNLIFITFRGSLHIFAELKNRNIMTKSRRKSK